MESKGIREEIQKRFETNLKGEFEKGFLLWICALKTLTRLKHKTNSKTRTLSYRQFYECNDLLASSAKLTRV
jgi:hypothetical protein